MHTNKRLSVLLAVFLLLFLPVGLWAAEAAENSSINRDIEKLLRSDELTVLGTDILTQALLLEIYQNHEFTPYWTRPDQGIDGIDP